MDLSAIGYSVGTPLHLPCRESSAHNVMGVTEIRFNRLVADYSSLPFVRDSWKILGAGKIRKKERRDPVCRAAHRSAAPEFILAVIGIRLFYSISPL